MIARLSPPPMLEQAPGLVLAVVLALALVFVPGRGTADPVQVAQSAFDVDVELVMAADGSGSISAEEFAFQRQGYAAALTDSRVVDAIQGGFQGRIAIAHVEWGAARSVHTIVDWHVIEDAASARAYADTLLAAPRVAQGWNSISNAMVRSRAMIENNAHNGFRKVIDISADAGQRGGVPLSQARATTLAAGITVNGLVLNYRGGGLSGPGGMPLAEHFRRDIIGGPGAFVVEVDTADTFVEALVRKLVLEIAGHTPDAPGDYAWLMDGPADGPVDSTARR